MNRTSKVRHKTFGVRFISAQSLFPLSKTGHAYRLLMENEQRQRDPYHQHRQHEQGGQPVAENLHYRRLQDLVVLIVHETYQGEYEVESMGGNRRIPVLRRYDPDGALIVGQSGKVS